MGKRVNRDDIDKFHDYGLYIPSRTIYIGPDSINDETPEESALVIKNLTILDSSSDDPLTIIMNCPGGDVVTGLAIYDAIKMCRCQVIIKVFGQASSMGSVILQAADVRLMSPNAVQMIHYGHASYDESNPTLYKLVEEDKRVDKWMEELYMSKIRTKHSMFKLAKLKKMLTHDTYFTAQQSIDMGLADGIIEEGEE